jgi:hypothetical protein
MFSGGDSDRMCGFSASFRIGTAARLSMNVPRTLTSCMRSYFFAASSSEPDRSITEALFTTMSMPPNSPWVFSTAAVMSSSLRTSPTIGSARRPPRSRPRRCARCPRASGAGVGLGHEGDVGAVARGPQCDGEADAAAAAGHEDGLSGEACVSHVCLLRVPLGACVVRVPSGRVSSQRGRFRHPISTVSGTCGGQVCELLRDAGRTRPRARPRRGVESRADRLRLVGEVVGEGAARTRPDEALGLPERRRRVLEPERRDLARAGAGVVGELGDEPQSSAVSASIVSSCSSSRSARVCPIAAGSSVETPRSGLRPMLA